MTEEQRQLRLELQLPADAQCEAGGAPGSWRITGLPSQSYHMALQRYSASTLKQMLRSPANFQQQFTAHWKPSAAMEFGTLLHLLILEPQLLPLQYVIIPGAGSPSAAEKREALQGRQGMGVLCEVQLHEARLVADKVLARPVRGRPFYKYVEEGMREVTHVFTDPVTQLPCRCRFDLWHPDAIFDLKTTRHPGAGDFARAAVDLHYDLQAYMYCYADAIHGARDKARDFVFVAVQNERPHPVHVLTAGDSFMANGEAKFVRAMSLLQACSQVDWWPDASSDETLEIEHWQQFRPVHSAGLPLAVPNAVAVAGATPPQAGA